MLNYSVAELRVINFFYTICLQKYEEYLKQKNKYKKKAPISVKIHR